jgi:hypothetical protein
MTTPTTTSCHGCGAEVEGIVHVMLCDGCLDECLEQLERAPDRPAGRSGDRVRAQELAAAEVISVTATGRDRLRRRRELRAPRRRSRGAHAPRRGTTGLANAAHTRDAALSPPPAKADGDDHMHARVEELLGHHVELRERRPALL